MQIRIYNNSDPPNKINKTPQLIKTLEITLKENCSVYNPVVILALNTDLMGANYAYIPKFNRYYFIVANNVIDGRLELSMRCDVLQSFPKTVKNTPCVWGRTSSKYNSYLPDNDKISSKHYIANLLFDSTPFTTSVYVGDDPSAAQLAHYVFVAVNDGQGLVPPSSTEGGES